MRLRVCIARTHFWLGIRRRLCPFDWGYETVLTDRKCIIGGGFWLERGPW